MNQSQSLLLERVKSENADHLTMQDDLCTSHLSSPECHSERQTGLTDQEREAAITRAGNAMEAAYAEFGRTGRQEDLDRAYRHLQQMRELVGQRSQAQVRRMESERGLGA